jgi:hypothetical protein
VVHSRMTATPHLFGFDMICECDGLAQAAEHVRTARRYIYEQERGLAEIAAMRASSQRAQIDDQRLREDARGMVALGRPAYPGSRSSRIVSVAQIRLDSRKSVRSFKGIICDDISEFESYMPSQAVSLWAMSGLQNWSGSKPSG